MSAVAWPPADPFANLTCGGCGRRRADGHARNCPDKTSKPEPVRERSTRDPHGSEEFWAEMRDRVFGGP